MNHRHSNPARFQIDWLLIIGWSQIARRELLETPACGCLGMHPSLLPIGRGRAAIPWAILKGLDQTGVTCSNSMKESTPVRLSVRELFP
jgi:methionyl-tRNA formyltransferase